MSLRRLTLAIFVVAIVLLSIVASAENIDPNVDGSQYAYGENVGWLNFEPNQGPGVTVSDTNLTGYVWAENIGWINLDPNFGGVANDGTGLLSGYAWGENVGWINFNPKVPSDPNHYGVTIDHQGNFDGWAWGENIGWIHFQGTFWVDWHDLANLAARWLQMGSQLEADFYHDGKLDFLDYSILANHWLSYGEYKLRTSWIPGP